MLKLFFRASLGQASLAYFFLFLGSSSSGCSSVCCICTDFDWAEIGFGFSITVISGAGLGSSRPNFEPNGFNDISSDDEVDGCEWSGWSRSMAVGGSPAYRLGDSIVGCKMFLCKSVGEDKLKVIEADDATAFMSNLSFLVVVGTTVVCTKFLKRPIDGSTSSGFIIISSSLNVTRFLFSPAFFL